jgi:NCAIR mutase (PurE)-related protein
MHGAEADDRGDEVQRHLDVEERSERHPVEQRAVDERADALTDGGRGIGGADVQTEVDGRVYCWTAVVMPTPQAVAAGPAAAMRTACTAMDVVTAGTSDLPVAQEALLTARVMGANVELIVDVGVAGLHRILRQRERLASADVVIVVAGMDGALPSVVGGLVDCPVIAVPTSIGYGAAFGGVAALLTMLNSCAAGVVTVNIDAGFKAGYAAALMVRKAKK